MDGEVIEIVTQQGQTVIASQTVPVILKLADLSTMTVHAQVAEADVIRVKAGLPVYFTVLGAPDRPIRGKLRAILPTPEKSTTPTSTRRCSTSRTWTASCAWT